MTSLHRIFLASMLLASSAVQAQTTGDSDYHPMLSDRFFVNLGLFNPTKDFKLRVDGQSPGNAIDFEKEVGAKDSQTTAALGLHWRFGEKWSVSGQYWAVDSGARWQLDEDVQWEDVVFKQGTFAEIGTDLTVYRVFFGRKFWTRPGHEFGAGIGLHWMEIEAFLAGQVIIDDVGDTEFQRGSVDAAAPLPNIGAWYLYSWSPKWGVVARVDWLSASIGDYSGGLTNAQAGIHYQLFNNVGLGLSWNYFSLDVDVEKSDWRGKVESKQNGPFLSFNVNW